MLWQPLPPAQIAATLTAATTAQARVFVVLAAVHAARPGQIRALHLDHVQLAQRRLTIDGHPRPLDELTHQILTEWLTERRRRWPNTANPHLIINMATAIGLNPVSAGYLAPVERGLPATLDRLRIDRQLEEALTSGGDPLAVVEVFGVSTSAAIRYAINAHALLARPHDASRSSPRTRGVVCDDSADRSSGSS